MMLMGNVAWSALMNRKMSGRHGAGLSCKPGRGSREDVALQPQLLVLTPQPRQLLALVRRQPGSQQFLPATFPQAGLPPPSFGSPAPRARTRGPDRSGL